MANSFNLHNLPFSVLDECEQEALLAALSRNEYQVTFQKAFTFYIVGVLLKPIQHIRLIVSLGLVCLCTTSLKSILAVGHCSMGLLYMISLRLSPQSAISYLPQHYLS